MKRNYCLIEKCAKETYAIGLCAAHYGRKVAGRSLAGICRAKKCHVKSEGECAVKGCGAPAQIRRVCPKHYRKARTSHFKDMLVRAFGGICSICEKSYTARVMDFHHRDPTKKNIAVANLLNKGTLNSFLEAVKESAKCDLVCSNCHRELHSFKPEYVWS